MDGRGAGLVGEVLCRVGPSLLGDNQVRLEGDDLFAALLDVVLLLVLEVAVKKQDPGVSILLFIFVLFIFSSYLPYDIFFYL